MEGRCYFNISSSHGMWIYRLRPIVAREAIGSKLVLSLARLSFPMVNDLGTEILEDKPWVDKSERFGTVLMLVCHLWPMVRLDFSSWWQLGRNGTLQPTHTRVFPLLKVPRKRWQTWDENCDMFVPGPLLERCPERVFRRLKDWKYFCRWVKNVEDVELSTNGVDNSISTWEAPGWFQIENPTNRALNDSKV